MYVPLISLDDRFLGVKIKDYNRSPDISLEFPQIERAEFLVGEVGYSDSGNLTRRRANGWLDNAGGT
jgi:hypothetical protein